MQFLIRNSAKCLSCDVEIESKSPHDFKMCGCPNELFVDGGLQYIRRGAISFDKVEETSIYADESYIGKLVKCHEKVYIVTDEKPTNDARMAHLTIALLDNQDIVSNIPLTLPRYKRMGYEFV